MNREDVVIWFALLMLALGIMTAEAIYFYRLYKREKWKSSLSIQVSVLQASISQWHDETFGKGTPEGIGTCHHTIEECNELIKELQYWIDSPPPKNTTRQMLALEEFADIFILMSVLATKWDTNLESYILEKMIKNKKREWSEPDENGVVRHTKEG